MADFGATDLDTFRAEAKAWLEANYPAELRDAKQDRSRGDLGRPRLRRQRATRRSSGCAGWPSAAGPRRPGPSNTAAAASRRRGPRARPGAGARRATARRSPRSACGCWGRCCSSTAPRPRSRSTCRRSSAARSAGARAIPSPARGPTSPSLQTRCEDKGDHWLINGQKIWTSYANKADWCFCLVRTDTSKKHEGICFVLIDMALAGRRDAADPADQRRVARSARPSSPT